MSIKYIIVSIYELDTKYLAKVVDDYKASIRDRTLVYSIKHNTYFTSSSTPLQVWHEDVICHTQDEFIQTVEQYKLLKLLNQCEDTMTYKFISLPIELASEESTKGIFGERTEETVIICYLVSGDIVGFSEILSEKAKEYMCESEEEFHKLVGEYRLLGML